VPPGAIRLGGWLGGALQWHLALAWLFVSVGLVYAAYQALSGNYRQVVFTGRDVPGLWPMIRHYVLRTPKPSGHGTYNPLQKLAYTTAIVLGIVLVVTGFALYKPVQLSRLVAVLGGFRMTRIMGSDVEIVGGMVGADGMCRPVKYNVFVFVASRFAGVLSPTVMTSRLDSASGAVALMADAITAQFARYAPTDPLCCPSSRVVVRYRIDNAPGPVVVPIALTPMAAK
jgi:hypothetical protein